MGEWVATGYSSTQEGCTTHLLHQSVEHDGELDGVLCLPDLHLEGGPLLLQLGKVCLHLTRVVLGAEHLGGGGHEALDAFLKHLGKDGR